MQNPHTRPPRHTSITHCRLTLVHQVDTHKQKIQGVSSVAVTLPALSHSIVLPDHLNNATQQKIPSLHYRYPCRSIYVQGLQLSFPYPVPPSIRKAARESFQAACHVTRNRYKIRRHHPAREYLQMSCDPRESHKYTLTRRQGTRLAGAIRRKQTPCGAHNTHPSKHRHHFLPFATILSVVSFQRAFFLST